ncbi:hypothetical protein NDU88_008193 [Pleurodeles waltl]|uniref:Uncharacterized protein n=1 Tax=Pleurodeles waltl TaxID=8319 RepID=A0AAV7RX95_PLEWA|nr:hypothetical protein NDU88_008193 [Pleurodeles waltl]
MAQVSGERAPAFTAVQFDKLVDGVLRQYTLLYCQRPPEEGYLACHRQGSADLGVYYRRSTHCRKRWEDLRRWSKKTAEAQLGLAFQRGRGARRTMTPLMFRTLAVAYPELDGRLRPSQQPQGGEYSVIKLTLCASQSVLVGDVGELGRVGPLLGRL